MTETQFDAIVYHADCPDGIMSLWCANKFKQNEHVYGCKAGVDPTNYFENLSVVFVDICPSIDYILKLVTSAKQVVILDHHKSSANMLETNKEILDKHKNLSVVFDMERSGCQLVWDYFFKDQPRPFFVDYVADRDLWQWKLPMSKEINGALYELDYYNPNDFTKLNELFDSTNVEQEKEKLIEFGKIIINMQTKEINYSVDKAVEGVFTVGENKYRIWMSDNIKYRSEVGAQLCHKVFADNTLPDFSVIWRYNIIGDEWFISMRANNKVDVSLIAQQFPKGGGHKNASGFTVKDLKNCFTIVKPITD